MPLSIAKRLRNLLWERLKLMLLYNSNVRKLPEQDDTSIDFYIEIDDT